jgi:hypothetical protein
MRFEFESGPAARHAFYASLCSRGNQFGIGVELTLAGEL